MNAILLFADDSWMYILPPTLILALFLLFVLWLVLGRVIYALRLAIMLFRMKRKKKRERREGVAERLKRWRKIRKIERAKLKSQKKGRRGLGSA